MNSIDEATRLLPDATNQARESQDAPMLTPVQQRALADLEAVLDVSNVVGFIAPPACGATIVLRALARRLGGRLIDAKDMVKATEGQPADAFEEAIGAEISKALTEFPLVIVDDLLLWVAPASNASTRPGFVRTILRRLVMQAVAEGKRLVMVGAPLEAWETAQGRFSNLAAIVNMPGFGRADYEVIAANVVRPDQITEVDFGLLFRYASHLQGYQLRLAFSLLAGEASITTAQVIDCLARHVTASNTRVDDVESISFSQLPGHEEIIKALQTHILMPMENQQLAEKMGLRPKRGVLLYGPPGTGKTSIGRALAHQMKGKFFLIDGSFVSEPPAAFFGKLQQVIKEAKENAPSVLFIDDADVLFRIEHIAGLSRYLLTLLDGLESRTSSEVCVMMTAMDVRPIPEALLRSGRVELWLETKVPNAVNRARILHRWMGTDLPDVGTLDTEALAEMTEGFTPADLRRLVGDAKTLYASDVVSEVPAKDAAAYLEAAVMEIVAVRNRMADSLGDERLRLKGGKYPHNTMAGQCGW